jgi:uncharacterized protein YndB with AHSA1/START domain
MTVARFPVPPIVKTVTVRSAPVEAFEFFTAQFGRWWPLSRTHTGADPVHCAIEQHVGGRVFERSADGCETSWGTVLVYDPPYRLVFSWVVAVPAGLEQRVEIRFMPEAGGGTTVELKHSGWELLGDAALSQRQRFDRGWGAIFEGHFVEYANSVST